MISWALRKLMFWGLLGGAILIVVENRESLMKAVGMDSASSQRPTTVAKKDSDNSNSREMTYRADKWGHFMLDVHVNGERVNFMVDTGASLVVLNLDDARRAGLRPKVLDYKYPVQTANGVVNVALVNLRDLRIGQLKIRNVKAAVNGAPMGTSLLGNSFLARLPSYRVRDDRLIINW